VVRNSTLKVIGGMTGIRTSAPYIYNAVSLPIELRSRDTFFILFFKSANYIYKQVNQTQKVLGELK
jgi:hypothetical protein